VGRTDSRPPGREADRESKVQEANGIDAAMPPAPLAGIHPPDAHELPDGLALAGRPGPWETARQGGRLRFSLPKRET